MTDRFVNNGYTACMAAIHADFGLVHAMYLPRAFTKIDFEAFLRQMQLELHRLHSNRRIVVFIDNARIHDAGMAAHLGIELCFNLTYRPDLMGIEHYWRMAKIPYRKSILMHRANYTIFDNEALVMNSMQEAIPYAKGCAEHGWKCVLRA